MRWRLLPFIVVAVLAASAHARADGVDVCVSAYERAQELRRDAKLVAAREQLLVCAQPACPAITTTDCSRWLLEVEAALPTIVVSGRDADGHDVLDVALSIDGREVAPRLDGKPLVLDPGEHRVRGLRPRAPANTALAEQRILVREGEKNRLVTLAFPGAPRPVAPPPPPPPARAPVSPVAWVLAGLGVASLGVGITLDAVATSDLSTLRHTCAPFCSQGSLDRARTKMIVGDVLLGVGVVSLAGAGWLWLRRGTTVAPSTAAQIVFRPTPGGATAGLLARF